MHSLVCVHDYSKDDEQIFYHFYAGVEVCGLTREELNRFGERSGLYSGYGIFLNRLNWPFSQKF